MPRKAHSPMKGFVSQRRHTIMQFTRLNLLWDRSSSGRPRQRAFDSPDPPALPRPSVSHGPSTAPLPPLEPSLRSLVAKRYPWSRLRGTAAGLLEHRLEVRLRGLQSILVTPTYREPHGFSSFPLLCGNRAFHHFHCFAETGEIVRSRLFSNLFPLFFRQAQSGWR